jgi:hypothetical protein
VFAGGNVAVPAISEMNIGATFAVLCSGTMKSKTDRMIMYRDSMAHCSVTFTWVELSRLEHPVFYPEFRSS